MRISLNEENDQKLSVDVISDTEIKISIKSKEKEESEKGEEEKLFKKEPEDSPTPASETPGPETEPAKKTESFFKHRLNKILENFSQL